MKPYAEFDRSQFPIITVTFTGERENPENFKAYLQGLQDNYRRKEPFTLIFDASHAAIPDARYAQIQGQWMKDREELIQTYCRAVAYVIPSTLLRKVLQLIFKVRSNPVPFTVTQSLEQARTWAGEQYAAQAV